MKIKFASFILFLPIVSQAFCFQEKDLQISDEALLSKFHQEKVIAPLQASATKDPHAGYSFLVYDPPLSACQVPTNGKWPSVLYLPGSGQSGTNNTGQVTGSSMARSIVKHPERFCAVFIFPQTPKEDFWDSSLAASALNATKLSHAGTAYELDPKRQYAMGFSLGAFGVCDLLRQESGMAGGVSYSGCLDDDKALPTANQICRELKAKPIAPLWMFQGTDDRGGSAGGVDPKSTSIFWEGLRCASKTNPLAFSMDRFTQIQGMGHCSWQCQSVSDLNFKAESKKNPEILCSEYQAINGEIQSSGSKDHEAAFHWLMQQSLNPEGVAP